MQKNLKAHRNSNNFSFTSSILGNGGRGLLAEASIPLSARRNGKAVFRHLDIRYANISCLHLSIFFLSEVGIEEQW